MCQMTISGSYTNSYPLIMRKFNGGNRFNNKNRYPIYKYKIILLSIEFSQSLGC